MPPLRLHWEAELHHISNGASSSPDRRAADGRSRPPTAEAKEPRRLCLPHRWTSAPL
ncbi:hypothetical protein M6B38_100955 [Iris pallida]|uniref:Uncharacterized protein n=1 Tax=Iris pallida TaxID=29817 RepID=A0AAX6IM55_IRIPA|nr:hypothetical protein M6B38_100955 [Iris pallida]